MTIYQSLTLQTLATLYNVKRQLQANIDLDHNPTDDQLQLEDLQEFQEEEDTLLLNSEALQDKYYSTAIDAIPDCPMIQLNKPATEPATMDQTPIPAKKVGCVFVTNNLHKHLGEYSQLSDKQVFLDIYHMLALLDHYLHDNPRQHIHCMSYLSLIHI